MGKNSFKLQQELFNNIVGEFGLCKYSFIVKTLRSKLEKYDITDTQRNAFKRKIFKELFRVPLKWYSRRQSDGIYSLIENPSFFELISVFDKKAYACYFTALFLNDLTQQIPATLYVAIPKVKKDKKSVAQYKDIDFEIVRDVFMKKPRESAVACSYQGVQYIFVERDVVHSVGLIEKEIAHNNRKVKVLTSDLESTVIDCVATPHRSGGISSLISAIGIAGGSINVEKLYEYYLKQGFLYPYWQRIGFLFEIAGLKSAAAEWGDLIGLQKIPFFLMHEYRASWKFNKFWQIYYPSSLYEGP